MTQLKIPITNAVLTLSETLNLVSNTLTDHHKRVSYISSQLAEELNFSRKKREEIIIAGELHDIGAIPFDQDLEALFFDEVDESEIEKHAQVGAKLLEIFSPFQKVAEAVYHHHAFYSETRKKSIPLESYIIHLADRVDIMWDRKKEILSQRSRIERQLKKEAGGKLAPKLVEAFLEVSQKEAFWFTLTSERKKEQLKTETKEQEVSFDYQLFLELAKIFGQIIDFQSSFTASHSGGVSAVAEAVADLFGRSGREQVLLKIAGYFHDIGKLKVPGELLEKPGDLKAEEYNLIKQHPYYTYYLLDKLEGNKKLRDWAAFHHESLDGSGYPFRLKGEKLSMPARIMAVSDILVALSENRPYREAMEEKQVKEILRGEVEKNKLDQEVVGVLIENYDYVSQILSYAQDLERSRYQQFRRQFTFE